MEQLWESINGAPAGKLFLTLAVLVAVLIAAWLLLRNLRLWYWKTDQVIGKLDQVNRRMQEMEENLDKIKVSTEILLNRDVRYLGPVSETEALEEGGGRRLAQEEFLEEEEKKKNPQQINEEEFQGRPLSFAETGENEAPPMETGEEEKQAGLKPQGREEKEDPQLRRVRESLRALQKQKEQLEEDLNARIRL